jgi:hypothetical protein
MHNRAVMYEKAADSKGMTAEQRLIMRMNISYWSWLLGQGTCCLCGCRGCLFPDDMVLIVLNDMVLMVLIVSGCYGTVCG